ncbi:hypothetical protein BDR26DRAFT_865863, partial [Obelidium mucronatum]
MSRESEYRAKYIRALEGTIEVTDQLRDEEARALLMAKDILLLQNEISLLRAACSKAHVLPSLLPPPTTVPGNTVKPIRESTVNSDEEDQSPPREISRPESKKNSFPKPHRSAVLLSETQKPAVVSTPPPPPPQQPQPQEPQQQPQPQQRLIPWGLALLNSELINPHGQSVEFDESQFEFLENWARNFLVYRFGSDEAEKMRVPCHRRNRTECAGIPSAVLDEYLSASKEMCHKQLGFLQNKLGAQVLRKTPIHKRVGRCETTSVTSSSESESKNSYLEPQLQRSHPTHAITTTTTTTATTEPQCINPLVTYIPRRNEIEPTAFPLGPNYSRPQTPSASTSLFADTLFHFENQQQLHLQKEQQDEHERMERDLLQFDDDDDDDDDDVDVDDDDFASDCSLASVSSVLEHESKVAPNRPPTVQQLVPQEQQKQQQQEQNTHKEKQKKPLIKPPGTVFESVQSSTSAIPSVKPIHFFTRPVLVSQKQPTFVEDSEEENDGEKEKNSMDVAAAAVAAVAAVAVKEKVAEITMSKIGEGDKSKLVSLNPVEMAPSRKEQVNEGHVDEANEREATHNNAMDDVRDDAVKNGQESALLKDADTRQQDKSASSLVIEKGANAEAEKVVPLVRRSVGRPPRNPRVGKAAITKPSSIVQNSVPATATTSTLGKIKATEIVTAGAVGVNAGIQRLVESTIGAMESASGSPSPILETRKRGRPAKKSQPVPPPAPVPASAPLVAEQPHESQKVAAKTLLAQAVFRRISDRNSKKSAADAVGDLEPPSKKARKSSAAIKSNDVPPEQKITDMKGVKTPSACSTKNISEVAMDIDPSPEAALLQEISSASFQDSPRVLSDAHHSKESPSRILPDTHSVNESTEENQNQRSLASTSQLSEIQVPLETVMLKAVNSMPARTEESSALPPSLLQQHQQSHSQQTRPQESPRIKEILLSSNPIKQHTFVNAVAHVPMIPPQNITHLAASSAEVSTPMLTADKSLTKYTMVLQDLMKEFRNAPRDLRTVVKKEVRDYLIAKVGVDRISMCIIKGNGKEIPNSYGIPGSLMDEFQQWARSRLEVHFPERQIKF